MARLEVLLLGSPVVHLNGRLLINFESDKGQALLFYLAVESTHPVRRETLAGLLWPNRPERLARRSLSQALYNLRQITSDHEADPPLFLTNQTTLRLNFQADIHIDTLSFDNHLAHEKDVKDWQGKTETLFLYRGDFLSGFSLPSALPFEEWLSWRREHYHRLAFTAHQRLVQQYELTGQWQSAIEHARAVINLVPWQEDAHQTLMRLLAVSGQRHEALAQYEICCQVLKTELNVEPRPETTALYEAIRSGKFNELGKRTTPVLEVVEYRQHKTIRTNISEPTISFVGRERELQELQQLLATPTIRLVTVVGAGGMGKTQLALACARLYIQDQNPSAAMFKDGIFFVNLAPLSDVDGIIPTLARSVSFQLQGSDSRSAKQQVLDYLHQKKMLLILDNFEHLLAGVDIVNDILQAVPGVKFIATSRERLQMQAEQRFPIHGLKIPLEADFEDLETFPAVQLFLQFARRHQLDFTVNTAEDYHDLHRICVLTEGMPLALELAAAWIDTLSLAEIVKEIERSLDFLKAERRDVPKRHHSITAAFQASWENLAEQEQTIFAQLSVFRGGFTREAAQAVTNCSIPVLAKLAHKSFLSWQRNPDRYQIHELMRQFGGQKLNDMPEIETAVQRNHAKYFCTYLHEHTDDWHSSAQLDVLVSVAQDIDNVEVACQYTLQTGEWRWLLQAMDSLMQFYEWNGRYQDAVAFCQTVINQIEDDLPVSPITLKLQAKVLSWQGKLIQNQEKAIRCLDQCLEILRRPELAGDDTRREEAYARFNRAFWLETFDLPKARSDYQQGQKLCREIKDMWGVAFGLKCIGVLHHYDGEFDVALKKVEASLSIQQELTDPRAQAGCMNSLGLTHRVLGHFEEAENLHRQSLQLSQKLGEQDVTSIKKAMLAETLLWQGKFKEAEELAQQSLAESRIVGHSLYKSFAFDVLSDVYLHTGRYALAEKHADLALEMVNRIGSWTSTPYAHLMRGMLALFEADYTRAQTEINRSVEYLRAYRPSQAGIMQAILSYADCLLNEVACCYNNLSSAINDALVFKNYLVVMHAIPGAAILALQKGEVERAVELWALAVCEPYVSKSLWFQDVIGHEIDDAAKSLPADIVMSARARGQKQDPWDSLATLLAD